VTVPARLGIVTLAVADVDRSAGFFEALGWRRASSSMPEIVWFGVGGTWLGLFGHDAAMLETGTAYLRAVGPVYGFFGLGLSLYFASQGAGRLFWPLFAGLLRLVIAIGGGWLALRATGSLGWMFVALSVALVVYGTTIAAAVASGSWFRVGWRRVV